VHRLYRALLAIRRSEPALRGGSPLTPVRAVALDEDTLAMTRECQGQVLQVVVRLQGEGVSELTARDGSRADGVSSRWRVRLSSEDPAFAAAGRPPVLTTHGGGVQITFDRPSAVILERV